MIKTLAGLYQDTSERFSNRVFIRTLDKTITYKESQRIISRIVSHFISLDLRPGDRVIYKIEDPFATTLILLASSYLGITPVFLSPVWSDTFILNLRAQLHARLIVEDVEWLTDLGTNNVDVLAYCLEQRKPDDICIVIPTSGSTGESKFILRTQEATVSDKARMLDFKADDLPAQRMLFVTPLTHGNGVGLLVAALNLGAELAIPRKTGVAASVADIRWLDPTYINLVPRILKELFRQYSGDGLLFGPSARVMVVSGGHPDNELLRFVASQGLDIVPCYGSSETTAIAIGRQGHWREGWIGPLCQQVQLAPDGEVLVGPEHVATGDIGEFSRDGYLKLIGRKKDILNTYDGQNIHPVPIEAEVKKIKGIRDVVLVGDGRPFITALIVLENRECPFEEKDGFLNEEFHDEDYRQIKMELELINKPLELNHKIRDFLLFSKSFPYKTTQDGLKSKVDRTEIEKIYTRRLEIVYANVQIENT